MKTCNAKIIYVPGYYGNANVGQGVCCDNGCTEAHYLGGVDGKGVPQIKFKDRDECFMECFNANKKQWKL